MLPLYHNILLWSVRNGSLVNHTKIFKENSLICNDKFSAIVISDVFGRSPEMSGNIGYEVFVSSKYLGFVMKEQS